jgi:hypothetical protein
MVPDFQLLLTKRELEILLPLSDSEVGERGEVSVACYIYGMPSLLFCSAPELPSSTGGSRST